MEYTICAVICVVALICGAGVMLYSDVELSTEIGTTINHKPGIKVNDSYCYDTSTNNYMMCK